MVFLQIDIKAIVSSIRISHSVRTAFWVAACFGIKSPPTRSPTRSNPPTTSLVMLPLQIPVQFGMGYRLTPLSSPQSALSLDG